MALDESRFAALGDALQRFGDAWARGDAATLDALLSPRYSHIDLFGAFHDRAAWLAYAAKRAGRATAIEFSDVATRMIGDVAIVTGINHLRGPGVLDAADRDDVVIRFTQVWVWQDGRWLREAFQATPLSRKERRAS